MKHFLLLTIAMFSMLSLAYGQATVTVRTTDNNTNSHYFGKTGGIYFNNGHIDIKSDPNTTVATYAANEVGSMKFNTSNSIEDADKVSCFRVSPNPAKDYFVITGIGDMPKTMTLYSINGKQVIKMECSDGNTIDISKLPQGIYIVRIDAQTAKVVKH